MRLTKKQKEGLKKSQARINIFVGAVRSGKSFVANIRWLDYMLNDAPKNGVFAFTGVSNGTIIRNIITPLKTLVGNDLTYTTNPLIVNLWGREIYCFGAEKVSSANAIQGAEFAGCLSDELVKHHKLFLDMMGTRLSVEGAKWFATCNPDNPKHYVKTDYIDNTKRDIYTQQYIIDDNETLPVAYVKDIKAGYSGVFYDRYVLGRWTATEGCIYDFFDSNLHVLKLTNNMRAKYKYISIDYGTSNPTSFGLYGVNPNTKPKVWRERGYYYNSKETQRQKTDSEQAADLIRFIGADTIKAIIIDPAALSFKAEIKQQLHKIKKKIPIKNAKNSVINGIRCQMSMLKTGDYVIIDNVTNEQCIDDYSLYLWDDVAAKNGEDKPIKENDHTKDEERYMLYTVFGAESMGRGTTGTVRL